MPLLRDDVLVRANGDRVAFSEYGKASGEPVIFCHGWPSSRVMAELVDEAACELRVRIISPDRPGVGGSSFVHGRTLLEWPPLVHELADALRIEQFRVLAISGGAPYAYAMGWAMSERVRAIAVVSGAPHIAELEDRTGLLALYRWLLSAHAKLPPPWARLGFRAARPFLSLRPPRRSRAWLLNLLQPCDADSLRDERAFEACFESQRRAWETSADGVLADAEVHARPWGFSLRDVRVPVRLWHGDSDRSFSAALAEATAAQLPNCKLRIVRTAGHYSTPIQHMREILEDLMRVEDSRPGCLGRQASRLSERP
ncbi:MAG: alpha/beta fold hydrolase [Chthoniobacterales bacterium]